jgi:uncharacterized protein
MIMIQEILRKAAALAAKTHHIIVATADSEGLPHIALGYDMKIPSDDHLSVTAWFCPITLSNIRKNEHIAFVVWDEESGSGYQLSGTMKYVEDLAMLNGFSPEKEEICHLPQTERRLIAKITRTLALSRTAHSDLEEESLCV